MPPITQSSSSSFVELTNIDEGRGRTTFSGGDGSELGSLDGGGPRLLLVNVRCLRKYDLGGFFSGDRAGAAD